VKIVFVSAAEGGPFAKEVNDFADEIRAIGPNPIRLAFLESGLCRQLTQSRVRIAHCRIRAWDSPMVIPTRL